jgi:glycosyltransferase involved in cell wall biosynthesis
LRTSDPTLHVALYAGMFIRFDAVSTSLLHKVEILQRKQVEGWPIEFTVFTQGTEFELPEIVVLETADDLVEHPLFQKADAHIFEFGMHYELFDAIEALPEQTPILAVDHSTTPPELVDSAEARGRCEAAIARRDMLRRATHVTNDSEFNRDHLLERGFPPEMLSVLHLPPACSFGEEPAGRTRGRVPTNSVPTNPVPTNPVPTSRVPVGPVRGSRAEPIHVLFVGRFVRAKGVDDLLRAVTPLLERDDVRLTLVGDVRFSDPKIMASVDELLERHREDGRVQLASGIDDRTLGELYLSADIFALPSYHEGYCVPVVEALWAGCYPVTYDAGNLSNSSGGLGALVSTGDVESLADALRVHVERLRAARGGRDRLMMRTARGELSESRWRKAVRAHLEDYSMRTYERKFLELLQLVASAAS